MFSHQSIEEEVKLDVMQRQWQPRRVPSSSIAFFEEVAETEDVLTLSLQVRDISTNESLFYFYKYKIENIAKH